jgi:hypothetical protein
MASQIKNTLSFSLEAGQTLVLAHGLKTSQDRPLAPDIIHIPSPAIEVVSSDDINVTIKNKSGDTVSGAILVEWWHSIERAFGDINETDLPVKPYIVIGADDQPPQGPFAEPPVLITIFARPSPTGNDGTGDGSLAKPYATMQRAVRDIPSIIPPNVFYFVNMTGVNEVLPFNYTLPAWKAPQAIVFANFGLPIVLAGAVTIYADPQPFDGIPLADTIINAGDVLSVTSDPLTGQTTLNLNASRTSWDFNALKGQKIFGPSVDALQPAVAYASTTTSVTFTTPSTDLPLPFPLTIMQPGASIASGPDSSGIVISAINIDSIAFYNLKFIFNFPLDFNTLFSDGNSQLMVGMCDIPALVCQNMAPEQTRIISSWVTGFSFFASTGAGMFYNRSLFDGVVTTVPFTGYQAAPVQSFHTCVFDGCDPIEPVFAIDDISPQALCNLNMEGCLIKNGRGDGMIFHGAAGRILNTDFSLNAGNGITVNKGGGQLRLENVGSSTPNFGDYGLVVDDGLQVSVDAATSGNVTPLKGTTGAGTKEALVGTAVGSIGATAWATVAVLPNNVPDPQTFARLFQR